MSFQLSHCQAAFKTGHFLLSMQLQSPLTGTVCVSTNLGLTQQHAGTEKWASYSSDLHSHIQQWTILVHSAPSFITSLPASLNYPRWNWADSRFAIKIKERWGRPLIWRSSCVTGAKHIALPKQQVPIPTIPSSSKEAASPAFASLPLALPFEQQKQASSCRTFIPHSLGAAKFTLPELDKNIKIQRFSLPSERVSSSGTDNAHNWLLGRPRLDSRQE